MENFKRFLERLYLSFRLAKILIRRRKYSDLKASGERMRYITAEELAIERKRSKSHL